MPRSVDIILRHETVEKAKAGDKVAFTGTLIVVPDVAQLSGSAGRSAIMSRGNNRSEGYSEEGITGLRVRTAAHCVRRGGGTWRAACFSPLPSSLSVVPRRSVSVT